MLKLGKLAGDELTCKRISVAAKLVAYSSSMLNPLLYTVLGEFFQYFLLNIELDMELFMIDEVFL